MVVEYLTDVLTTGRCLAEVEVARILKRLSDDSG